MKLDNTDRRLLNLVQGNLPLRTRPFDPLAEALGLPMAEVLQRTQRLKDLGIIRQISAIFDTRRLGYHSTLVAARVAPGRLAEAAAIISGHPGVSHNYARNHEYNLWFTLAVSPDSRLGLPETAKRLGQLAEVDSILLLPTLRRFKIGVHLDMTENDELNGEENGLNGPVKTHPGEPAKLLTTEEKEAIRRLQQDLPLVEEPFRALCENTSLDERALVERGKKFLERGVMRRFAAVLRHRKAGYHANAMGVWLVPETETEAMGKQMALHPRVSHCYERPAYPEWPYTIFTMVHGRTTAECEQVFRELSERTGIQDYDYLFSTQEFKKVRVRYLTPEEAVWESENLEKHSCPSGNRLVK